MNEIKSSIVTRIKIAIFTSIPQSGKSVTLKSKITIFQLMKMTLAKVIFYTLYSKNYIFK